MSTKSKEERQLSARLPPAAVPWHLKPTALYSPLLRLVWRRGGSAGGQRARGGGAFWEFGGQTPDSIGFADLTFNDITGWKMNVSGSDRNGGGKRENPRRVNPFLYVPLPEPAGAARLKIPFPDFPFIARNGRGWRLMAVDGKRWQSTARRVGNLRI